jgi:hypothetical protein
MSSRVGEDIDTELDASFGDRVAGQPNPRPGSQMVVTEPV